MCPRGAQAPERRLKTKLGLIIELQIVVYDALPYAIARGLNEEMNKCGSKEGDGRWFKTWYKDRDVQFLGRAEKTYLSGRIQCRGRFISSNLHGTELELLCHHVQKRLPATAM